MQRLLPKYEVDRKRREEDRQRMDEGMRIAERVDSLRETLATEESAFEKYRTETLRGIQEEISFISSERDSLAAEVSKLRNEQIALSRPLEVLWEEAVERDKDIEAKIARFLERKKALDQKAAFLGMLERQVFSQEKAMEVAERRIAMREAQSKEGIEKANLESERLRIEASVAMDKVRLREINAKELEKTVSRREKEVKVYEAENSRRSAKLDKREASLKASWALLQKTAERLTHKQ